MKIIVTTKQLQKERSENMHAKVGFYADAFDNKEEFIEHVKEHFGKYFPKDGLEIVCCKVYGIPEFICQGEHISEDIWKHWIDLEDDEKNVFFAYEQSFMGWTETKNFLEIKEKINKLYVGWYEDEADFAEEYIHCIYSSVFDIPNFIVIDYEKTANNMHDLANNMHDLFSFVKCHWSGIHVFRKY